MRHCHIACPFSSHLFTICSAICPSWSSRKRMLYCGKTAIRYLFSVAKCVRQKIHLQNPLWYRDRWSKSEFLVLHSLRQMMHSKETLTWLVSTWAYKVLRAAFSPQSTHCHSPPTLLIRLRTSRSLFSFLSPIITRPPLPDARF